MPSIYFVERSHMPHRTVKSAHFDANSGDSQSETKSGAIDILMLANFVRDLANEIHAVGAYPTLGAEGKDFYVDICSGHLSERVIHKTIHLPLRAICESHSVLSIKSRESIIQLRDACEVIAFVFLLSNALGADVKIIHPLDDIGDFLPTWEAALAAA